MQQQLAQLVAAATQEASAVATRAELEAFKARVVGPNGSLTQVMKELRAAVKAYKEAGGAEFTHIPCLNDQPVWIDFLERRVRAWQTAGTA